MRTTLALILFFIGNMTYSQVIVEDVNINEIENLAYCQVVASGNMFSNKVKINIDYGQHEKKFGKTNSSVKNKDGKAIKFNSVFDAINFMANNGWKLIDAYPLTTDAFGGKKHVYHYTFEKIGFFN